MKSKMLVIYATLSGSTAQVAEVIGETLRESGVQVDVRPIKEVEDVSFYDAVLVGGPMIMGWHREAVRFVKKHQGALSQKPVAYFITALSLTETGQERVDGVPITCDPRLPKAPGNPDKLSFKERYATPTKYLAPVLKKAPQVRPVSVAFLGGKLVYTDLNLLQMLFVMLIVGARPGDFRNWEVIRGWATGLGAALLAG